MHDDMESQLSDDSGGENLLKVGSPLREQDRFLPIANITKIMKRGIPESGKIAKDARECIQECVSEFISFITSEASDRCHMEKRKTINGEDVLCAMYSLGFENYTEPLKVFLSKYRETIAAERLSSDESHEPTNFEPANEHTDTEPTSNQATLIPVTNRTEILYQTNDGAICFKHEPYEQM
ncbi:uncharacterized protein LOC128272746 [Anopheles cruzii]|uniref:uncharacterized protein LOC128272746 n=1 Tax=Anopheles cruzii TaxID=68878 RepID=UPI0022EC3659|nr:uncharacterized protein LOC128272746 [Anopheles cruzii]